jgi:hypothetical protein
METSDPLWLFVHPLNRAQIPYMVTGATAAILYGAPRLTNDLDLVVQLSRQTASALTTLFPDADFYLPPEDVLQIERSRPVRGHFNIIHLQTGYKADVYLRGTDPLHIWGLEQRRRIDLDESQIWVAPPEYVIIRKLEFYREGGSEKHLLDIRSILTTTGSELNHPLLNRELTQRGLMDLWHRFESQE